MPRYDFRCHDCRTIFEEQRAMAQATAPAACPQCGSDHTYKLLSQIAIVSGDHRAQSPPPKQGGCACGGSCACGAH